jgi:hypothetical protein
MKNKFKNNWQDEKQVDITSKGEKISQDNKIEIEIIKTKNGRTDEDSVE